MQDSKIGNYVKRLEPSIVLTSIVLIWSRMFDTSMLKKALADRDWATERRQDRVDTASRPVIDVHHSIAGIRRSGDRFGGAILAEHCSS